MNTYNIQGNPLTNVYILSNTQQISGQKYPHLKNEYGTEQKVKSWISAIKDFIPEVSHIEADESAYYSLQKLSGKTGHLVINFSEGFLGRDRESHFPSILEMLNIPYAGGSPLNKSLALNKSVLKMVLQANGISTSPFFTIEKKSNYSLPTHLEFPLFVKPDSAGSSSGILPNSKVNSEIELRSIVEELFSIQNSKLIVESFLPGREFTVGLLGNQLLPIVEVEYKQGVTFQSEDVKFKNKSRDKWVYVANPKLTKSLENSIYDLAERTFSLSQSEDIARLDIKCDLNENPYILEINVPPSTGPKSTFGVSMMSVGYTTKTMFEEVIKSAVARYNS